MPAVHSVTEDAPTSDHSIEGSNPSSNYCNGHAGDYDGGLADYVNSKVSDGAYGSNFGPSPIAICGLALRLPGGIHDADSFWDVLVNGKDMRGPIPADRYNPRGFDDTLGNKGAIKTQHGYFIDEDLSNLDASFFSMTQNELEKTDPQQRQILEVTRECLENAGEVDYRGKPVGCYVGTFGEDWLQISAKESQHSGGYIMTGHGDLMIANRVSFEFDFQGPSMVIKTGCSASLVGLHEACRALQSGDCTSAIVAGTNLILGPTTTAAMTQEGILSCEGSCKTFDAAADGFARGEAITAVYIKLLDDALKDRNPIRAVVRNTGTNSDGKSASILSPNGKSHELLMKKVYQDAGLDPAETAFVECHGTGTPTGDPIETTAVGNVFGEKGTFIGSVKPNVGHSEGASGITSLIKCILALEHRTIPPNIKFKNPNPKIPFMEKHLKVPIEATSWPEDRALRVSINSFGIGGANAVILDSFNGVQDRSNGSSDCEEDSAKILVYSANTQDSLRRLTGLHYEYNENHPEMLSDVAYTLALRREHLNFRAFAIANGGATPSLSPLARVPTTIPDIVMVFSGQGAQWSKMGADLFLEDPRFTEDIESMNTILQSLSYPPDWKLEDEFRKPEEISRLHLAELAQPLCTAVQIALVNKLTRSGVRPQAVIGHSSGEIAAAYASGVLSMPAALILAYYRGYVTKQQNRVGGMAAIGLGSSMASIFLEDGVVIACENSPTSVTISGDLNCVQRVVARIEEVKPGVLARMLKVDMAYHSHHMETLSCKYRHLVEEEFEKQNIILRDPDIPFFSSVTNVVIASGKSLGPRYWESNLTSPVLFNSAVSNALKHRRNSLFLEIGPHSTLAGPIRETATEAGLTCVYIPTMLRTQNCQQTLLSAFGQLYQQGLSVDFQVLAPHGNVLTNLPAYPWDHGSSYWYESRVSKDWRFRKFGHHRLLGSRVPESSDLGPCWRNVLQIEDEPWLYDHKIQHDVVFPFAGYCTMAGEAIRQITGVESGYSLRHVIAHTALVLTNSKPVEMVTTLRQHRLTDSSVSDSWDFVVSSYSGSAWINHCEGQVQPRQKILASSKTPERLLRSVKTSRWYEAMAAVGIIYGSEFQGLIEIASSTTQNLATGVIIAPEEAGFLFPPTSIDACLQLLLVALAKGIGRNFAKLRVPTMIEELNIWRSTPIMHVRAWSLGRDKVGIECFADGKLALRISGIHLTPLENEETSSIAGKHAAARLEWRPHFDFIDHSKLFTAPNPNVEETIMQEEMSLLCMIDSAERLKGLQTKQPHFAKFRDWLSREIHRASLGTYPVVEDSRRFLKLTHASRSEMIEERFQRLTTMSNKDAVAIGIRRIWDNIEAIFTGQRDALDVLMQDNALTEIYNVVSFGHAGFIQTLSHTKPRLRILEVGAGTGGTTQTFLHDLVDAEGYPKYLQYTFTDISAGFFPQAKERFSYAPNMDYRVFDISRNPFDQGFEPESYDLILAPNVVHATPVLCNTLKNLQPLLARNGHLVLTEISAVVRTLNYIFGTFSGWWLGEADERLDEPYVSIQRWDDELKAAGFTGADTVVYDAEEPYQYCAVIVSQPKFTADKELRKNRVTVICNHPDKGVAQSLIVALKDSQYLVSARRLGDTLPQDEDILCTLDLEGIFFEDVAQASFSAFQEFLRKQKSQKVVWLTAPCQVSCKDPTRAQSIGMTRTIRSELGIPYFTLEIDRDERNFSHLVLQVFEKVQASEDTESLLPDREYVVSNGVVKVGRYHPFSLLGELSQKTLKEHGQVKTLEIGKPGLLETLHWAEGDGVEDVPEGHIEIEAREVGLNFRDVVFAMGIISSESESVPLGLEMAGTVCRVGSSESGLGIGDRVFALAPHGCITTRAVVPGSLVVRIPDNMSFEEAATVPICFTTAIQSLVDVGHIQKGQSVLIHSAAGGVGHAAIQICKMVGAKIFATVGSEEKAQYLTEKLGIPRHRIFNSRDDSFVSDLMSETAGKGADVVLNSLSGELLHASWRCVAEFGRLIEIGKRDLAGFGKLDMQIFLANRSYCCVDIAQLIREKPEKMRSTLTRWLEWYEQGYLTPISPVESFGVVEAEQAFRALQRGNLIGKAVIHIPEDLSGMKCAPKTPDLVLDPTASYLLTGGLGGLGKPLATWMVERGARYLIFLSRSAGQSENDKAFFKELETLGCSVAAVPGKVQDMDDVEKAIAVGEKPIKGVIHLAMVLRDAPIVEMTHPDWAAAVAPKVDGAWNLHRALLNHPLDFFLLASSLVTIVDQPGQGNYNASNTFLEAFCQYRHSLSLPASVLNICPIEGVGFVAENPQARRNLKAQGLYFLGEQEFLDYVALSIMNSQPPKPDVNCNSVAYAPWENPGQLIMGLRSELPLLDPNNRTNWRRDRRMSIYHNISLASTPSSSPESNSNALQLFLTRATDDPSILTQQSSAEYLASEIGKKVFAFMLKPEGEEVDISLTLGQIGLDSLMAIELRRWWKQVFGNDISVLEIMGSGTLEQLGNMAAERFGVEMERGEVRK